ncbi:mitochondrial amidoxime-reducing component 1 isoform X3 [Apis mellifera caucasica]|nr:mitochondrial amidoxime-reducing component 1 isoform X3 [Apis mellifera caucasica]
MYPLKSGRGKTLRECDFTQYGISLEDKGRFTLRDRFLTGTTSGLRLGCTMMDKRNLFVEPWKKFTQVYQKLRNKDTGLFSDLTSYMLMTTRSVEKLNEKLERPVPTLQFRPNILVSTQQPFEEDNWEWIKIGERVVIRNVKPCSRCKFVGVNPENGVMDKEEPLKTLRSYEKSYPS